MAPESSAALESALARLYRRTRHGIRPGLERIHALMNVMRKPHEAFLSLHVAGTNGKGSVCAMIESVLRAAGLHTGLYTSPHLLHFNERIRLDGRPVDDAVLERQVAAAEALAVDIDASAVGPCTFFELSTAMAFDIFRESAVQVAVVETGMGGRWDATNVVMPIVSVVTDVGVDHAEYLGDTVAAIAGEKAGIIKPGRPVICGTSDPEATRVIAAAAHAQKARRISPEEAVVLRRIGQDWTGQKLGVETASRGFTVVLPLLGDHQARNLAAAVAALEVFETETGLSLPDDAFSAGLACVQWPARIQVLAKDPPVLLDGAHNPHAASALVRTLRALAGDRRIVLVAGMLREKDAGGFAAAFAPQTRWCRTVTVPGERGRAAEELARAFRASGLPARAADLDEALAEARTAAAKIGGVVCAAGSLFLAPAVLRTFGWSRLFAGESTP